MTNGTKRIPEFEELVELLIDSEDRTPIFSAELDMEAPLAQSRLKAAELFYRGVTGGPFPEVDEHMHQLALSAATAGRGPVHAQSSMADGIQLRSAKPRPKRTLVEWIAELVYDSFGFRPVAAMRSMEAQVMPRLLHYRTESFEIDLALTEEKSIVGNVVPCGEVELDHESIECTLFGEDDLREAPLQPNGDFLFEDVRPGEYVLYLESEAIRIVVPKFEFPADEFESVEGGT